MARPPTKLTEIFYRYDIAKCYGALRARGALSLKGRLNKVMVIEPSRPISSRIVSVAGSSRHPLASPRTRCNFREALARRPRARGKG